MNANPSPLRFITLRRLVRNAWEDSSSLAIDGRKQTPGTVQVIGGLPHCAEIAPRTETDPARADCLTRIRLMQSRRT